MIELEDIIKTGLFGNGYHRKLTWQKTEKECPGYKAAMVD